MKYDPILTAVDSTLSIYLLMNRHSREEEQVARTALKLEFDQLSANGEHDPERLVVKGLTLLRQLDEQKPAKRAVDRLSPTQI
jgi:hypothetical protein